MIEIIDLAGLVRCPEVESFNDLPQAFSLATESAAIAAATTVGLGDAYNSDLKAVQAMRAYLNTVPIRGKIVIGEGIKDKAPMLYLREIVGKGTGPAVDIAVDPLEMTRATAAGGRDACSVLAASESGGIISLPESVFYMDKLFVGPEARGKVNIDAPVEENLKQIAKALEMTVGRLTIAVLRRERNQELINRIEKVEGRVMALEAGDLIPSVLVCDSRNSGIHAVMGIGGAPETVLAAAAVKALGGEVQARIWSEGKVDNRVFRTDDLVPGESIIFSATGVTDGSALEGVKFKESRIVTNTLLITALNGELSTLNQFNNF